MNDQLSEIYIYVVFFFICCLKRAVEVHDSLRNRIQIVWFFKSETVLPLSLVSELTALPSLLITG